jgi:hypothetical protein
MPANNENIDGKIEGFIIDITLETVEFFWNGNGWTAIK